MKQKFFLTGITAGLVFVLAIHGNTIAQDKKAKEERHIKILKLDSQGNKSELDTVVTHGNTFVWKGDTIGNEKEMKWQPRKGVKMDSIHKNMVKEFKYEIKEGEDGKIVIMKGGKAGRPMQREMREGRVEWVEGMPLPPMPPVPPMPAHRKAMKMKAHKQRNIIDLSDPGIITYDKKKLSGGREKITIIRKEVQNEDAKIIREGDNVIRINEAVKNGKKEVRVNVETEDFRK